MSQQKHREILGKIAYYLPILEQYVIERNSNYINLNINPSIDLSHLMFLVDMFLHILLFFGFSFIQVHARRQWTVTRLDKNNYK